MFDKLKKFKQLKDLKSSMEKERMEIEKEGTKVVINGKMEVEEVNLNDNLDKEKKEEVLRDCFNEAIKKIQRLLAERMMKM